MPDPVRDLTRAFNGLFRRMRQLAEDGGKERFGDWIYKVAEKIQPAILSAYKTHLAKYRGRETAEEMEAVAQQRALATARDVCDTTSTWLQEGRDTDVVFSADRAARCGITEASWAINTAKMVACRQRGKKVRWRLGGKGCKECKRLNGKVLVPGKAFTVGGKSVMGPPLHPFCMCRLVEA